MFKKFAHSADVFVYLRRGRPPGALLVFDVIAAIFERPVPEMYPCPGHYLIPVSLLEKVLGLGEGFVEFYAKLNSKLTWK